MKTLILTISVAVLTLAVGFLLTIGTAQAQGADKALDFDGSDDYVVIYDSPSLRINGDMTITAWIKPNVVYDTDDQNYQELVMKRDASGTNYLLYIDGDNLK